MCLKLHKYFVLPTTVTGAREERLGKDYSGETGCYFEMEIYDIDLRIGAEGW